MAHAIFAPSASSTWLPCPYSARHSVPEPPKPLETQQAADEGTRVHSLLEAAISVMEFPEDGDTAAGAIALGLDFIRQLERGQLHTELKLELTNECGGTTDVFNHHPHVATVLDLKNGKWDVDADHNTQMLTYGTMLLPYCEAPWWRFVIFQPNGLEETPFKQWVAHRTEVEAHRMRVLAAINDRSPPKPGPHCRWCKAFQVCPAMSNDANFLMGALSRPPETLATAELVRMCRIIRGLGDMKTIYEDALTTHLKMGRTADGALLKPGKRFRSWNDDTQAAQYLMQHFGARGVKPVSPKQAEGLGLAGKQYAAIGAHKPEAPLKASY